MELRTAFLPSLAGDVRDAVCVVIDALRATTVAAMLFARNCPRVYVAPDHETARGFARPRGYALCGETRGFRVPDFDYGNSPAELAELDFTDRPVVLSTTNGTRAVAAVAEASRVFLGAPVNRSAVAHAAREAARQDSRDIVLVCAGTAGEFTLEDATSAGLIAEIILADADPWQRPVQTDATLAARRLWETEPNLLRGWMEGRHALHLAESGFGADLGFCATRDTLTCVPTLVSEEDAQMVPAPVILVRATHT